MQFSHESKGRVVSVRGSVVDVYFPERLPDIRSQLQAGLLGRVQLEVVSHLDSHVVRNIALTPTAGLARGSTVIDTGHPLQVPVGEFLLGRMLNLFGEVIAAMQGFQP